MKRYNLVFVLVATLLFVAVAGFVFAQTAPTTAPATSDASFDIVAELRALKAELSQLKAEFAQFKREQAFTKANPETKPIQVCNFTKNMGYGFVGPDVAYLQAGLVAAGFNIGDDVQGTYGDGTAAAVVQVQTKYGLSPVTGYLGPKTRAKLNSLSLTGCKHTEFSQQNFQPQPQPQQQQQNNQQNQQTQTQNSPQQNGILPPPECEGKNATDANLPQSCKIWFGLASEPQQTQPVINQPIQNNQQLQQTQTNQQSYNTNNYYQYQPPSGQKEQIWNSNGLRSWIRNDSDQARIDQLKSACTNVSSGMNIWMPNAGNYSSSDFGMPDAAKCAMAAACTSNQYFDGSNCVSSQNSQNNSQTNQNTTACNNNGRCEYGESMGSCPEDCGQSTTYTSCYSVGTDESACVVRTDCVWYNHPERADGPSQNGRHCDDYAHGGGSNTNTTTCLTGQYWNGTACVSSQTTNNCSSSRNCYDSAICTSSGWYWYDGGCWDAPRSQTTGTGNSNMSCSSNQYWDGTACVDNPVQSGASSTSCPSGQYWNGTACQATSPTDTPPSSQLPASILQAFLDLLVNLSASLSNLGQ